MRHKIKIELEDRHMALTMLKYKFTPMEVAQIFCVGRHVIYRLIKENSNKSLINK